MVIFAADHGDHNGQFGLFFKSSMYESSVRTPLLIKPAGARSAGVTYSGPVNTLDLYATIAEVAGVVEWDANKVESQSLTPILDGNPDEPERPVFSILGAQTLLRRGELKLLRFETESGKAVYELYDLNMDPLETVNRFEDPDYGNHARELKAELDAWVTAHPWG